jgi:hypothetical protein
MACGTCADRKKATTFLYTAPDGKTKTYSSEIEVRGVVARKGGSYKPQ